MCDYKMKVKLKRPVEGKFGTYPADTWLEAIDMEGFIFVGIDESPNMKFKRVDLSNIKEIQKEKT